ncbi:hypothetical protein [Ruegeria sp. SCP11]|uniref:hypothetical protein n=1 Tax=Ruegeria sp. SCP11 TaxID=3141378 RepID=UPI003338BFEB
MTTWPDRIPFHLHKEFETRRVDDWQTALCVWVKSHGLKLKLLWWADLERKIADLHSYRFSAGSQDHWAVIREWLERNDVPALEKLPGSPELESVANY